MKKLKLTLLLITFSLLLIIWCGFEVYYSTGMIGRTKKTPDGYGCICHNPGVPTDTILVYITGPETVAVGSSNVYTLHMLGGPSVVGGFNVAAGWGSLQSIDTTTRVEDGELTHTLPKAWGEATVSWQFMYTAPATVGLDTIYSVGNSTNNDLSPIGDEFNYGVDFVVTVVDPLGIVEENNPTEIELFQNYPNPFNPLTVIRYQLLEGGFVSLKVFDLNGKEVSMLVDEVQSPGSHSKDFDGSGLGSGIYYYQLMTDKVKLTRKLLLLR
jgi:hypothetical protein